MHGKTMKIVALVLLLWAQGAVAADDVEARSRAALTAWLNHAQSNEPAEMLKHTQTTWAKGRPDAARLLEAWYGKKTAPMRIVRWRITGEQEGQFSGASRMFRVEAVVDGMLGRETRKSDVHVVCERAPYKPAADGKCGVNPDSVAFR